MNSSTPRGELQLDDHTSEAADEVFVEPFERRVNEETGEVEVQQRVRLWDKEAPIGQQTTPSTCQQASLEQTLPDIPSILGGHYSLDDSKWNNIDCARVGFYKALFNCTIPLLDLFATRLWACSSPHDAQVLPYLLAGMREFDNSREYESRDCKDFNLVVHEVLRMSSIDQPGCNGDQLRDHYKSNLRVYTHLAVSYQEQYNAPHLCSMLLRQSLVEEALLLLRNLLNNGNQLPMYRAVFFMILKHLVVTCALEAYADTMTELMPQDFGVHEFYFLLEQAPINDTTTAKVFDLNNKGLTISSIRRLAETLYDRK